MPCCEPVLTRSRSRTRWEEEWVPRARQATTLRYTTLHVWCHIQYTEREKQTKCNAITGTVTLLCCWNRQHSAECGFPTHICIGLMFSNNGYSGTHSARPLPCPYVSRWISGNTVLLLGWSCILGGGRGGVTSLHTWLYLWHLSESSSLAFVNERMG